MNQHALLTIHTAEDPKCGNCLVSYAAMFAMEVFAPAPNTGTHALLQMKIQHALLQIAAGGTARNLLNHRWTPR